MAQSGGVTWERLTGLSQAHLSAVAWPKMPDHQSQEGVSAQGPLQPAQCSPQEQDQNGPASLALGMLRWQLT